MNKVKKLYITISLATLFLLVFYFIYQHYQDKEALHQTSIEKAIYKFNERNQVFSNYVHHYKDALLSIKENKSFINYITTNNNKSTIDELFLSMVKSNDAVFQIRYIDSKGQEKVRVDKYNHNSYIVPLLNLQNKKTRYYFQEVSKTKKNFLWYSKIDLNMEHGEIEVPHKPTLRIGAPIYLANNLQGILVVNINLNQFIKEFVSASIFNIYLIDKDGEFLVHPDTKYSFGKYLNTKMDVTQYFEGLSKTDLQNKEQIIDSLYIADTTFRNSDNLKIIIENKKDLMVDQLHQYSINRLYSILILLIFMMGVLYIFFKKQQMSMVEKYNNELEDAIKEKTIELQKSIDIISENVIYSRTDKKGVITYASKAFCKISEYSLEELLGEPHNIIRHSDMSKEAFRDMWETIEAGNQWSGEVKNLKKNGGFYWVQANISPEYNSNGELIGYAAVRHDITHKKEIEELNQNLEQRVQKELEQNRQNELKLMEQAKMVSLGEMIGNIAHQWRQPLSIISTSASGIVLQKELGTLVDEQEFKMLNHIIENTTYLSETIDVFSDYIKEDKEEQTISVQELIGKILSITKQTLNLHHIKVLNNVNKIEPVTLRVVTGELKQVIINIINNAKDVLVERKVTEPWIKIDLEKLDNKIVIEIEDNGGGVSEDILPRIFEPYFTTKHQSIGTGLGLHMSYKIVTESFQGNLYAKNTQNGVKFFIELPLV